jgi:hypothetical protein
MAGRRPCGGAARTDTSYTQGPRRKSSHRDLRRARPGCMHPACSTPGLGTSDQWRGGGAAALAEDQEPAELQATHGGGTGGGPGQADIKGASGRSHGPAAERPECYTELGLREQESTHCWTGTTCRAASLACSDRSGERPGASGGHGWAGSKAVETTGSRVGRAANQDVQLEEFLPNVWSRGRV